MADVSIRDRNEFHLVSESRPLRSAAAELELGIIRMCPKSNDTEWSVGFFLGGALLHI
jgi:hypothetical protein